MHTRVVRAKHGPELLVRPLRHGDTATVQAVFDRLGEDSRRARFNGSKPRLGEQELCALAVVDASGIGSALTQELVDDACAAGNVEVTALVRSDNRAAFAVLSRVLGQFELRFEEPETLVRAPLPARC